MHAGTHGAGGLGDLNMLRCFTHTGVPIVASSVHYCTAVGKRLLGAAR